MQNQETATSANTASSLVWDEKQGKWICPNCGGETFDRVIIAVNSRTIFTGADGRLHENPVENDEWGIDGRVEHDVQCRGCEQALRLPDQPVVEDAVPDTFLSI